MNFHNIETNLDSKSVGQSFLLGAAAPLVPPVAPPLFLWCFIQYTRFEATKLQYYLQKGILFGGLFLNYY